MSKRWPNKTVIGLTGNIATGKSAVGRLLGKLGAVVIDADKVAHATMAPGSAVWQAIRQTFGPEIIAPDGTVDRRRLAGIGSQDPAALARLEANRENQRRMHPRDRPRADRAGGRKRPGAGTRRTIERHCPLPERRDTC